MSIRPAMLTTILLSAASALLAMMTIGPMALAQTKDATADTAALYKKHCLMCHAANGDSKLPGMSFVDGEWKHGSSVKEIAAIIRDGVKGTAMLPFKNKLNDAEADALARYVRAFDKKLKD
jgi:mono/diheme cytochrome c family protein